MKRALLHLYTYFELNKVQYYQLKVSNKMPVLSQ